MQQVQLINQSTLLSQAQLAPIMAALQTQVTRDFAPAHELGALLSLHTKDDAQGWPIWIVDTEADAPEGALAWHSADAQMRPYGIIPVKTILDYGEDPAPTIGHELLEMLADPGCRRVALCHYPQHTRFARRAVQVAVEVCDPCENDSYDIAGVACTNFALPAWFTDNGPAPYDFLRKLPAPLSIDAGGYMQWSADGRSWHQVTDSRAKARKVQPGYHSRLVRRQRCALERVKPGHHALALKLETAARSHGDPAALGELIELLQHGDPLYVKTANELIASMKA